MSVCRLRHIQPSLLSTEIALPTHVILVFSSFSAEYHISHYNRNRIGYAEGVLLLVLNVKENEIKIQKSIG